MNGSRTAAASLAALPPSVRPSSRGGGAASPIPAFISDPLMEKQKKRRVHLPETLWGLRSLRSLRQFSESSANELKSIFLKAQLSLNQDAETGQAIERLSSLCTAAAAADVNVGEPPT